MHPTQPEQGEFARLLASIQDRAGLSYQQVADAAGVNRSQVWRWVNSGSAPGYEPVRRLAAHLIAAHPQLTDDAAALLPAAGYQTAPVMAESPAAPELPRELVAEDADADAMESAVAVALTPRRERLIWTDLRDRLAVTTAGKALFADAAQSRAWPPSSAPLDLTEKAAAVLDAIVKAGQVGMLAAHPINNAAFRLTDYTWPQRVALAAAMHARISGASPTRAVRRAG